MDAAIAYDIFRGALERLEARHADLRELDSSAPRHMREAVAESAVFRFRACLDRSCTALRMHLIEEIGFPRPPYGPKPIFRAGHENGLLTAAGRWLGYVAARNSLHCDYDGSKGEACLEAIPGFIADAIRLHQRLTGTKWDSPLGEELALADEHAPPDDCQVEAEVGGIRITPEQREILLRLLDRHMPGATVWAYGSRVKKTSWPSSDLDLVAFAGREQSMRLHDLREDLEESDLPFRVDMFVWSQTPRAFREQIRKNCAVLVEGEGEATGEGRSAGP